MKLFIDYQGQEIRLTEERAKHIYEHPEMEELFSEISNVLKYPHTVVSSRSDENVNLYYRFYYATLAGDKWLCVIVKNTMSAAFVLTAYLTDKVKKGVVLWQNQ